MTIDILSTYEYNKDNIEKIENIGLQAEYIGDNTYKCIYNECENIFLTFTSNSLIVKKNCDVKYFKQYKLNEEMTSTLELNGLLFYNKIKTVDFKNIDNEYNIKAIEYTENNEFLSNITLNIKINKGEV